MQDNLELQIGKWGNSLGIRIPKHILESLHLGVQDRVSCSLEDGKLILKPLSRQKNTHEKSCSAKFKNPA